MSASGALLGYPDTGKARTVRVRIKDCSRVPKESHGNRRREGSEMGGRIDADLREANLGEAAARYTTMRYFLGVSGWVYVFLGPLCNPPNMDGCARHCRFMG